MRRRSVPTPSFLVLPLPTPARLGPTNLSSPLSRTLYIWGKHLVTTPDQPTSTRSTVQRHALTASHRTCRRRAADRVIPWFSSSARRKPRPPLARLSAAVPPRPGDDAAKPSISERNRQEPKFSHPACIHTYIHTRTDFVPQPVSSPGQQSHHHCSPYAPPSAGTMQAIFLHRSDPESTLSIA
ncbi:hypothetical protein LX32DRAFT_228638 [Colletotrichum zoysiae]|uniref:Uncharacterized protein n=1 Tax=Colletotrichum zoysiae TaxID=1216348 RepID=A0AAD9LXI9_9PEZI|nr:hypothetical protein LX32DRAFT_228638 [Colletotrichum zoysiae]